MKKYIFAVFIFSLLGLLVSGYLAYEYSLPTSITCPLTGSGCNTVRNSIYSTMLGISVPYFGIAYYALVAGLCVYLLEKQNTKLKILLFILGLTGFLLSLYLTFLEAFIIQAFCFWCIISAILATLIFFCTGAIIRPTRFYQKEI